MFDPGQVLVSTCFRSTCEEAALGAAAEAACAEFTRQGEPGSHCAGERGAIHFL